MIIVQWQYNVPKEKFDEFVKFAKEKLKPFWESMGCKSHSMFVSTRKRFRFSYQIIDPENKITEQLFFDKLEDFDAFLKKIYSTEEGRKLADSYEKIFGVTNLVIKIYEQVV
jgi:hypothetical protein